MDQFDIDEVFPPFGRAVARVLLNELRQNDGRLVLGVRCLTRLGELGITRGVLNNVVGALARHGIAEFSGTNAGVALVLSDGVDLDAILGPELESKG